MEDRRKSSTHLPSTHDESMQRLVSKYENSLKDRLMLFELDHDEEATQGGHSSNHRLFASKHNVSRSTLEEILEQSKRDTGQAHDDVTLRVWEMGSNYWRAEIASRNNNNNNKPATFDALVDATRFRYFLTKRLGEAVSLVLHRTQSLPFVMLQTSDESIGLFVQQKPRNVSAARVQINSVAILESVQHIPVQTIQQVRDILQVRQHAQFTFKTLPVDLEAWLWRPSLSSFRAADNRPPSAPIVVVPQHNAVAVEQPTCRTISPVEAHTEKDDDYDVPVPSNDATLVDQKETERGVRSPFHDYARLADQKETERMILSPVQDSPTENGIQDQGPPQHCEEEESSHSSVQEEEDALVPKDDDAAVANKGTITKSGYEYFKDLYGKIIELEFKPAGIHKNTALGCMWAQHKTGIGPECGPNCECHRHLGYLASSVVIGQLKKNNEKWSNPLGIRSGDLYPVGLAGNFASWVIPKLEETYPAANGFEIMQRLVRMWKIHLKQLNFGRFCTTKSCDCREGWELAFMKGASSEEIASSTQRKRASVVDGSGLPKKRKGRGGGVVFAKDDEGRLDYEISFKSNEPLGFYVVTENGHCTIASVCPAGTRDRRLQAATLVLSTRMGSDTKVVKTWNDLQQRYNEAKNKSEDLAITFTNKLVKKACTFDLDWSSDGRYKGKYKHGWDGRIAKPTRRATVSLPPTGTAPPGNHQSTAVRFASSKITRRSSDFPTTRHVEASTNFQLDSSREKESSHLCSNDDSFSHLLSRLVKWNKFDGVGKDDLPAVLEKMATDIKTEGARFEKGTPQHHEVDLKSKLVKIYIRAEQIIKESYALEHWTRLHIRFVSINNIKLSTSAESGLEISALPSMVYESGKRASLKDLPKKGLAEHIYYSVDTPPFQLNHNKQLTSKRVFEVRLELSSRGGANKKLGEAAIHLSELYQKCLDAGPDGLELTFPVRNGSTASDASGISVTIHVQRSEVAEHYVRQKRDNARHNLKEVLVWLARMKADMEKWEAEKRVTLPQLGADIRFSEDRSILHAAVLLRDIGFVRQIVTLGVHPRSRDDAHAMAQKASDHTLDKIIEVLRDRSTYPTIIRRTDESGHESAGQPVVSRRSSDLFRQQGRREILLPRLGPRTSWAVSESGKRYLCRHFQSTHHCRQRIGCFFVHCHGRRGEDFLRLLSEIRNLGIHSPVTERDFESRVSTKAVTVADRVWWTAAYVLLRKGPTKRGDAQQTIVYAEGGENERVSDEGISWYETKIAAIHALRDAVDVALYAEHRGLKPANPSPYH